jgi:hypothetical protein
MLISTRPAPVAKDGFRHWKPKASLPLALLGPRALETPHPGAAWEEKSGKSRAAARMGGT